MFAIARWSEAAIRASLVVLVLAFPLPLVAEIDRFYLGNGSDNTLDVAYQDMHINAYATLGSSVAAGATAIGTTAWTLADSGTPGFTPGALIMLHQAIATNAPALVPGASGPIDIGSSNVGTFELARIASIQGGVMHLSAPLVRGFSAPGAQIIRVPEYNAIQWADEAFIGCRPFSASPAQGGVAAFLSRAPLPASGGRLKFNCSGAGYSGASVPFGSTSGTTDTCSLLSSTSPDYGRVGVSLFSLSPSGGRGNLLGGGGGGGCRLSGGGGGGHGGAGGNGGGTNGGLGGAALVYPYGRRLIFGSGGGSSHNTYATAQSELRSAEGGVGGGIVFVRAPEMGFADPLIYASGLNMDVVTNSWTPTGQAGGGGSGAGGTIVLRLERAKSADEIIADPGETSRATSPASGGGAGGGGVIFVSATDAAAGLQANIPPPMLGNKPGQRGGGTVYLPRPEIKQLSVPELDPVIVTSSRPTISGRNAEKSLAVSYEATIEMDGQILATVPVDVEGRFSYTPTSPLAAGTHVFTASSNDFDMCSAASAARSVTLTACASDSACPASAGRCAQAIGLCVQCLETNDCAQRSTGSACLADFRCGCASASDCPQSAPLCLASQCRARCAADSECPSQTAVCNAAGVCAECADANTASCPLGKPFCHVDRGVCAQCRVNAHCAGVSSGGLCIDGEDRCGCGNDGDCGLGLRCDATSKRCEPGCSAAAPRCPSGFSCEDGQCTANATRSSATAAIGVSPEPLVVSRSCSSASPPWLEALALLVFFRRRRAPIAPTNASTHGG